MALNVFQGLPGSGKSYFAVNCLMVEYLRTTKRPIVTTVEINPEELCFVAAKGNHSLAADYEERITLLENRVSKAIGADGEDLGEHHERKEFWFFTKPNMVLFLDEAAEVFNSQNWKSRPETLVTYINQHRHYRDDLFLFCQAMSDLDAQIRKKVSVVWDVRNSLKEPMFGKHPAVAGYLWPWQFFICRAFSGRSVADKTDGDITRNGPHVLERRTIWPNKRGYTTYNSFSKSQLMSWKAVAEDDAESGDVGAKWYNQIMGGIPGTMLYASVFLALIYGGWRIVTGFQDMSKNYGQATPVQASTVTPEAALEAATEPETKELDPGEEKQAERALQEPAREEEPQPAIEPPAVPEPVTVVYASGVRLQLSDGRQYRKGQYVSFEQRTIRLDAFGPDGVFTDDGWYDYGTFAASAGGVLLFRKIDLAGGVQ